MLKRKTFDEKFKATKGLGRDTKKVLRATRGNNNQEGEIDK